MKPAPHIPAMPAPRGLLDQSAAGANSHPAPVADAQPCASCAATFPADDLTPVHGHGKVCWTCIELERDCA